MPQITVDYSDRLADVLDRRAFALELHPLTAGIVNTRVERCKTRFRRVETVVADGAPEHAVVHVEVALKRGRTAETLKELVQAVLELVDKHTAAADGTVVHASVEVRDLTEAYASSR
ncbi:5-carboxymethyl-2-hydroxymuconate Delta-isomerase [Peterkaempfera griseoplana]|uniref:5-carboxymethyl-2-hydroxymuconate Delta-isomerase n=1 Tax=Peterkaempfera griseoplana TaxID=66896 RepID=UPI0006E38566|nr:isomerase [Peterkaempfera griseoplana]